MSHFPVICFLNLLFTNMSVPFTVTVNAVLVWESKNNVETF